MSLTDFLFGRPLASDEGKGEKIGPGKGIGVFGLDALGSAVYGPEAALTMLLPLGLAGIGYIVPVTILIAALAGVVFFSYSQTIKAYPGGGGTYTVASENLGIFTGLVAGAALMIDYVLVVAVGISAGVGTLVSVFPSLQAKTTLICLIILFLITIVNLRGVSDSGAVFLIPAYLFIVSMIIVLVAGIVKILTADGNPQPVVPPPQLQEAGKAMTFWIFLRTFSNGCTAMTGVEAVSNGVPAFRDPVVKNARTTLTIIIITLIVMLIMIAYVARAFHIGATEPGTSEYKTVLYSLVLAVTGRGWASYIPAASILLIVVFQANTSFSGFPRLCSNIARQNFLPQNFANRGRRLVYSSGIIILSIFSGILLIAFKGVTDSLIPLFAVGAFIAFTLSQAGMVVHWKRKKGRHWRQFMIINGIGMAATAVTTLVVLVSKFTEGAWIVVLALAAILLFMKNVKKHYTAVQKQLYCNIPLKEEIMKKSIVVLPADEWNNNVSKALSFAITLSDEIIIFNVHSGEDEDKEHEEENDIQKNWKQLIEDPLKRANLPVPKLEVFQSPYRLVVEPVVDYVLNLESKNPDRDIAVLIPNLVERKWYHRFLHNQRGLLITGLLFYRGSRRTVIIYVPWYLKKENE